MGVHAERHHEVEEHIRGAPRDPVRSRGPHYALHVGAFLLVFLSLFFFFASIFGALADIIFHFPQDNIQHVHSETTSRLFTTAL